MLQVDVRPSMMQAAKSSVGSTCEFVPERLSKSENLINQVEQLANAVGRLEDAVRHFIGEPPESPRPSVTQMSAAAIWVLLQNVPLAVVLDTTPDRIAELTKCINQAIEILFARLN